MMMSIDMKFFTVTFFVLIQSFVTSTTSDIHQEAIVGERTELECTTDLDIDSMKWEHIPTGSESIHSVYVGKTPSSTYADRFSLNALNLGRTWKYNLVIEDVHKEDAGQYICRDQEHQAEGYSQVQLTILETSPICLFAVEREDFLKTDRSCLQADDIRLTCKVNYFGDTPPVLVWRDVSRADFNNTIPGVRNGVENSIHITTQWDQFTFMCHSNLIQTRPCHVVIPQPHYMFRSDVEMTLNGPHTVTCSANSSQTCTYQWLKDGSGVPASTDQHLELTTDSPSGKYICMAQCQFRSTSCSLSSMSVNFENKLLSANKSANEQRNISRIAFGILGGIFGIIILSMIDYLWRRGSFAKLRNICCGVREKHNDHLTLTGQINLKRGDKIKGLTFSEEYIYVIRQGVNSVVRYQKSTLIKMEPDLRFRGLKEPRDLRFCTESNNVYVTDLHRRIFKMNPDLRKPSWRTTADEPDGISITSDNCVIIAFPEARKLIKYSEDLKTEKMEITLIGTIVEPRHALEMSDSRFLVCYGKLDMDSENGVVIVSENGEQIGNKCKYFVGKSAKPLRIAITAKGLIVVATYESKEILLLYSNLAKIEVLVKLNHNITRMCLDNSTGSLYVADHEETPTIFIYNIKDVNPTNRNDDVASARLLDDAGNNNC